MRADRQERLLAFAFVAAAFMLVLAPERGYVPIWDGRVYANCAVEAAASGLSFETLRCASHPTQGYVFFLALSQTIRLGDVSLMHVANMLLGLLALAGIRLTLYRIFPAREHARALDLLTLVCALHPVLLSTLVQPNVDFGVYVFFFASLGALVNGWVGWAAMAGLFLCFSKETGVLAYGLMVGLEGAFRLYETKGTWRERITQLLPFTVAFAPLVAFVSHVLWWNATHAQSAIWKHQWQKGTLDGFNFFDLSEPIFVSYAAGIFVLGFMWVVSAIIAGDLVVAGVRQVRRLPRRAVPGSDARALTYVTILTVILTYALTSFRTWSNLRYFALIYPLLLFLAFAALLRLGAGARLRGTVLVGLAGLFLFATYRSADPVSRAVYGTYSIGERQMYRMASITGEFPGPGRDQLVYNLEFTGYHDVQNALFRQLHPTDSTVFATARLARWNIWSQLDARTWRRTLQRTGVIVPRYWDDESLLAAPSPPPVVWWLEFSYRADADSSRERLAARYRQTSVVRTTVRGHTLVARKLERLAP